ncbi:MAG TPA: energy-converting hydrogenase B subunit L EhbL, partial [Methanothermobacter thermautotrophicus]|nr:energy-converting hydrogenase B subunit L EhbL [Methanothermobacter thermautotrophicus]
MKNLLRIMLEGSYTNLKRIFLAADRVTDMELRRRILEGRVEP